MDSRSTEGDVETPHTRPVLKWIIWGLGVCTIIMITISFIGCLLRGHLNKTYYLLASNLILSALLGAVNAWWYKNGYLASDKYWYIIILAAVIIWQTISTDIYIFSPVPETPNFTTAIPLTTMKDF